jgi:hypothetical protein
MRERCSPLSIEREATMHTHAANSSRAAWRDKSMKNRGFETPPDDDQGGALRRLQSRADGHAINASIDG